MTAYIGPERREGTRDQDALLRRHAAVVAEEVADRAVRAAALVVAEATTTARILAAETRVDLTNIKTDLNEIKARLDSKFVSIDAFDPIKRLVYGLTALMLGSVVVALLALVIRQ